MSNLMGLIIKGAIATVLIGGVTACDQFPFPGDNETAQQTEIESAPEATEETPTAQTPPTQTAPQTTQSPQGTAQAPQTVDPGDATTTEPAQDTSQPIPALW
jgi:hypothetical protein